MKDKISELLYNELDYIYCDNCKFFSISEEESNEKYGYWGCEDCYRKYMGWKISKKFSDKLAEKIMNIIKKGNE